MPRPFFAVSRSGWSGAVAVSLYVLGWRDLSFLLHPFHSLQSTYTSHIHILIMYILPVYLHRFCLCTRI